MAPGYRADIVFLDLASIGYAPLNDVLLQLAVTLDRFVVAFPVGFPYTWRRLASESDGRAP
ncbi:MAG: hypothetical protein DMD80_27665 [Candidatus Rokuibacteriota bacterium]|nr:MAG: hypothetical protein DMD80_27665 [Candidatus Rokubacteria bacterium]